MRVSWGSTCCTRPESWADVVRESQEVVELAAASRGLRSDRELAFDGAEDLTPSEFYREQDAAAARNTARLVVERVRPHVLGD